MTDAELETDRLREQLARERTARAQSDYARVLLARGTDPDDAARMAAALPERVRDYTPSGEPVIALASGKTLPGAAGLRALALEQRITADRQAVADPTNERMAAIIADKRRSSTYSL